MCCLNLCLLGAFLKERIYFHVHVGVALKKYLYSIPMRLQCARCALIKCFLKENGFRVGFSCFVFEHFLAAEAFLVPSIALLNS